MDIERNDELGTMLRDLMHQAEMISQAAKVLLRLTVEANRADVRREMLAERIEPLTSDLLKIFKCEEKLKEVMLNVQDNYT